MNVYDDVFDRNLNKADLDSVFKKIETSDTKNIIFKLPKIGLNAQLYPALKHFTQKTNSRFKVLDQKDLGKEYLEPNLFWYICLYDINGRDCSVQSNKRISVLEKLHFNSIDIKLLEID